MPDNTIGIIGGADGPTTIILTAGVNPWHISGIILLLVVLGVAVFHIVHDCLYCRYQRVPGKSHCAKCGHRKTCQKYHKRRWKKDS